MTPKEFKAWFEGFTEAFAGVPTKAQWERIKTRVGEIDGNPVTERVYLDRYWPPRYWQTTWQAPVTPSNPIWLSATSECTQLSTATN